MIKEPPGQLQVGISGPSRGEQEGESGMDWEECIWESDMYMLLYAKQIARGKLL